MKTTLLATITPGVFLAFAPLTFAGGQEGITAQPGHDASLSASTLAPAGSAQMPSATKTDPVRPTILFAAPGNDAHPAGAQTVWLDGSISGRPWRLQGRQVH